jgi:small subunit ribosomal protein S20
MASDEKTAKVKQSTALKRNRNSRKANLRNRARISQLKTLEKNFRAAVAAGDASAAELAKKFAGALDRAAKVGTIHANRAANKKSQADKLLNTIAK